MASGYWFCHGILWIVTRIDLSDGGDAFAVLGILTYISYYSHVYTYSYNDKSWVWKGDDLIANVVYADGIFFESTSM